MDTKKGMLIMVSICILVLAIGFFRRKAEILFNFFLRSVSGGVAIYFMNLILMEFGIRCTVGINLLSLLTVGTLGTGGFGLLYGIIFYDML